MMPGRFLINNDDPTDVIEFSFIDTEDRITKDSVKNALRPPYRVKYYVNIVLTVTALIIFLLWNYGVIPGNQLGFFCHDPLFSHKYQGDTIEPWMLGLGLTFLFPMMYTLIEIVRRSSLKGVFTLPNLIEFYVYLKQMLLGELMVGGVTEIAKTIVGEHRPHFFDTCMPDTNQNCTDGTYMFHFTCINPKASKLDIVDASRSFPSGHSSISWFAVIFCAYVVHSRLPTNKAGTALKIVLFGICITFGLACSLTRITDRRHHWWDVLVGTILGLLGAAYVIRNTHVQIRSLRRKMCSDEMKDSQDIGLDLDV